MAWGDVRFDGRQPKNIVGGAAAQLGNGVLGALAGNLAERGTQLAADQISELTGEPVRINAGTTVRGFGNQSVNMRYGVTSGGYAGANGQPYGGYSNPTAARAQQEVASANALANDLNNAIFMPIEAAMRYPAGDPRHQQAISDVVRNVQASGGPDQPIYFARSMDIRLDGSNRTVKIAAGNHSAAFVLDQVLQGNPALAQEIGMQLNVPLRSAGQGAATNLATAPAAGATAVGNSGTELVNKLDKAFNDLSKDLSSESAKNPATKELMFAEFKTKLGKLMEGKTGLIEIPNDMEVGGQKVAAGKYAPAHLVSTVMGANAPAEVQKIVQETLGVKPEGAAKPVDKTAEKHSEVTTPDKVEIPSLDATKLAKGSDAAKKLQEAMEAAGFKTGQKDTKHLDGIVGPETQKSLKAMAEKAHMSPEQVAGILLNGNAEQQQQLMAAVKKETQSAQAPVNTPSEKQATAHPVSEKLKQEHPVLTAAVIAGAKAAVGAVVEQEIKRDPSVLVMNAQPQPTVAAPRANVVSAEQALGLLSEIVIASHPANGADPARVERAVQAYAKFVVDAERKGQTIIVSKEEADRTLGKYEKSFSEKRGLHTVAHQAGDALRTTELVADQALKPADFAAQAIMGHNTLIQTLEQAVSQARATTQTVSQSRAAENPLFAGAGFGGAAPAAPAANVPLQQALERGASQQVAQGGFEPQAPSVPDARSAQQKAARMGNGVA